ncbi:lectin-like [Protopterus annectens]|uniref:lectin-like n=1 Tax=Protopterus annectens TaxID=7888 RepID=UPI001CFB591B|nr:lectin-like [Protopterus annectens]
MKSAIYMLILINVAVYADRARKDICGGKKQYQFINETKTYADAELYCQQQWRNANGHLGSILNKEENKHILDSVNITIRNNFPYVWIGAVRLMESKTFIWIDGCTSNYSNWRSGQPDNINKHGTEACAEMYTVKDTETTYPGQWNDNFCGHKRAFICQHF